MSDVEDDGITPLLHKGDPAHVNHEVVVTERAASFRHQDPLVRGTGDFQDRVPHLGWREELAFLDVHCTAGGAGLDQQVRLAGEERRDLNHVADFRRPPDLSDVVHVRQNGHLKFLLDSGQNLEPRSEPRPAVGAEGSAVRFIERSFEDERNFELARRRNEVLGEFERVPLALDDARPGDQEERPAAPESQSSNTDKMGHEGKAPEPGAPPKPSRGRRRGQGPGRPRATRRRLRAPN